MVARGYGRKLSGVGQSELQRYIRVSVTGTSRDLPKPTLVIDAGASRASLGLSALRQYHELLYFLIGRDLKLRYKQTLLGAAWAVLQPLAAMLIFTLFLGRIAGISSGGIPYPVFAYAGLLAWTFFANSVGNASTGGAPVNCRRQYANCCSRTSPVSHSRCHTA